MCGCCDCDDCVEAACCCLPYHVRKNMKDCLICLAVLLVAAAIVAGVVVAVLYGRPLRRAKIRVVDASLTRFDLVMPDTPTTALAYNLTLALTLRNTNWPIGITYDDPLDAAYSFDGQQFDRVQVADAGGKVGGSKTVVYHLSSGSEEGRAVLLGNAGEAEFRKENATGVFEVDVALTGKFKYTLRWTKCKIEATCQLKLQLAPPGATAVVFQEVDCEVAKSEDKNC
ncbi:hypothetical protein U9M48_012314 [Paspalum notatum var. saurae]|uniref:Late embryogenesis abundant protein LEA-2 subgroup domain-containing protein n=1 Tax=Paspalum notatum var. saurae TaxID=547442 RepID=A0AAQ3WIF0_PASNO